MQVMCAARRALRGAASVLAALGALASVAHAQAPVIPAESAVPAAPEAYVAPPVASTAPPPAAPPERVPAFTATPAPAFTQPPPEHVVRDARFTDASVDRVVLVPTAETHPAGTVYLSSYDIFGLQAGYALGDRTQVTLSFVPPLSREPVVPLDVSLKTVLVRSARVRVAAMVSASGILGLDEGATAVGRVGGVTQLCFDDACRSSVSTAANLMLAGPALILADGVGAIVRASDLFAFLFELQSVLPLSRDGGRINVLAGAVGFRLSGRVWAVDLAFEGPLDRHTSPQAVPVVIATVRFF
jgi:hypothetical protein